jgi:hypothetical protein
MLSGVPESHLRLLEKYAWKAEIMRIASEYSDSLFLYNKIFCLNLEKAFAARNFAMLVGNGTEVRWREQPCVKND